MRDNFMCHKGFAYSRIHNLHKAFYPRLSALCLLECTGKFVPNTWQSSSWVSYLKMKEIEFMWDIYGLLN